MPPRYLFDPVTLLQAGAEGEPGRRTFFLQLGYGQKSVRMWMEKETLQGLGQSIEQVLASLPNRSSHPPQSADRETVRANAPAPDLEFQVGQLILGYDEDRDLLVLVANESDATDQDQPVVGCWATRGQMSVLSKQIVEVCAAGRPRCPLCGEILMGDGHMCARTNGHARHPAGEPGV